MLPVKLCCVIYNRTSVKMNVTAVLYGRRMKTCFVKSFSLGLLCVSYVGFCQFVCFSLLDLRVGCGI